MRHLTTALILGAFALSLYATASAQSSAPTSPPVTTIGDDTTKLIADTKAHTVIIVIEGKEVARFDADGLHVTGNIDYSGFSTDTNAAPPAADCDADTERGRMSIDTTNNRLYVCNGATRGWDYVALTN